jgi:hypothetical protein
MGFFHNQLDSRFLPPIVVFVRVCNGVFGVDERNRHREGLVDVGLIVGCKDKFFRFLVFAGDDE